VGWVSLFLPHKNAQGHLRAFVFVDTWGQQDVCGGEGITVNNLRYLDTSKLVSFAV